MPSQTTILHWPLPAIMQEPLEMTGTRGAINDLKANLDMGSQLQQGACGKEGAFHALSVGISGLCSALRLPQPPVFQLDEMRRSEAYHSAAIALALQYCNTIRVHGNLQVFQAEMRRYTDAETVTPHHIQVLLEVIGSMHGRQYRLGLIAPKAAEGVHEVVLWRAPQNPNAHTIWLYYERQDIRSGIFVEAWFALAPPLASMNAEQTSLETSERLENKIFVDGAPPSDTQLPWGRIVHASFAEILAYFPNHCLTWPGLAILLIQKGYTAEAMAQQINMAYGTAGLPQSEWTILPRTIDYQWSVALKRVLRNGWTLPQHISSYLKTDEELKDLMRRGPLGLHIEPPWALWRLGQGIVHAVEGTLQFWVDIERSESEVLEQLADDDDVHGAGNVDFGPLLGLPGIENPVPIRMEGETDQVHKQRTGCTRARYPDEPAPRGLTAEQYMQHYPNSLWRETLATVMLKYSEKEVFERLQQIHPGMTRTTVLYRLKATMKARAKAQGTTVADEQKKFAEERRALGYVSRRGRRLS
ncbi:hypothetical protein LTR66_000733 [Elasticomyces elasticus]|nr:hypothetical protein LTR66_000733 [Elasticomyces elasticus]